MKLLVLLGFLTSTLFSYETLQPDEALTATDIAIERGYSIVRGSQETQFFAYKKLKKPVASHEQESFNFVRQIQKNDPFSLIVQRHKQNRQEHERVVLDFFDGTHDVQAFALFDQTFIAARNALGHLYVALLHPRNHLTGEHIFTQFEIKKIHKIFSHINGDFTILATQNNRPLKGDYFNRGSGNENILMLRLSSSLNIQHHKQLGGTAPLHYVDATLGSNETLTLLAQSAPNQATLLTHTPFEEVKTQDINLTQAYTLTSITPYEGNFLLGTQNTLYLAFNPQTQTVTPYVLKELKNASITTLSTLPNNSLIISGNYANAQGEYDLFIQKYAPNGTLVWDKRFGTPYNEFAFSHALIYSNIYFFGSGVTTLLEPQLLSFSLDQAGKHYKVTPLVSAQTRFNQTFSARLKEHNITIASLAPHGDITFDFNYAVGSHTVDEATQKALEAFAKLFLDTLQDPKWFAFISQIYLNGLSSSEWNNHAQEHAYIENASLGHKRAMTLLNIMLKSADSKAKETVLFKNMSTNSHSSNGAIKNDQGLENFAKSRRNTIHIEWKTPKPDKKTF